MRNRFFLSRAWLPALVMALIFVFPSCQNNDPVVDPEFVTLKQALENIAGVSSIEANPDTAAVRQKAEGKLDYKAQCSLLFTQDLDHNTEGGETFQQRVCIVFRGFDRPTILVTHGYFWPSFKDATDLGINLNANLVHVEHRNFGVSTNSDYGTWNYQTTKQAAADLHAVFKALKAIFPGKWISSGTSKNGENSMCYAYYYPNDMNLAISFCSPFMTSLDDQRFGNYLFEEVGSPAHRDLMRQGITQALTDGENGLYKDFCQMMEAKGERPPVFAEFVFNLFDTYFQTFQYTPDHAQRQQILANYVAHSDSLITGIYGYMDTNRQDRFYPYFVECAKQLGWLNEGYAYFGHLLQGTSFRKEDVLPSILRGQDKELVNTYDGAMYQELLNNFFPNPTCPLLLFYAHDDPWIAGAPPQLGPKAKMIVNPMGKHSSDLNDPSLCPPAIKQEVMDYVNSCLK